MIRFLAAMPDFGICGPAAQPRALRSIAADLSDPSWTRLSDAVTAYLNLVEAGLSRRGRWRLSVIAYLGNSDDS